MAEQIISLMSTNSEKLSDLSIKNGQIIFVKDKAKVALDLNDKRTFYNDITILDDDESRECLLEPFNERFYFVVSTGVLWFYKETWIQVTDKPKEFISFETDLPELGDTDRLYINKQNKNISVWDDESSSYLCVGETTDSISNQDIDKIFRKDE